MGHPIIQSERLQQNGHLATTPELYSTPANTSRFYYLAYSGEHCAEQIVKYFNIPPYFTPHIKQTKLTEETGLNNYLARYIPLKEI